VGRIHLFEWEDQPWFPAVLRDAGTAFLTLAAKFNAKDEIAEGLVPALRAADEDVLVDLCSGGGGPIVGVVEALAGRGRATRAILTDLFPNIPTLEYARSKLPERIDVISEPVDATAVPEALRGVRTLFNGFHHFRPEVARALLLDAVEAGQPIAIYEFVGRTPIGMLGLLMSPLNALLAVPFLRPFRWSWLFFSYVVPVIPLFILWDGIVSGLRVYSVSELRDLVGSLGPAAHAYEWDIGAERMGRVPAPITYLIGIPKSLALE